MPRSVRIFLAVVILLFLVYLALALIARPRAAHPFFQGVPDGVLVIAHQGGDGLWPSNTRYAFERAVALGVDVLEMDVHASADGALVVIHDD
ncbi:MAG: glycerophosphodiester phosphodiesterase family protein, partial [Planctomycetota bacterium]